MLKLRHQKNIVKELEKAIFGYDYDDDKGDKGNGHDKDKRDDKDKKDKRDNKGDGDYDDKGDGNGGDKGDGYDGEWDGYEESIGERVKLKNQDKIKEKKFKEDYATGYDDLDKIGSLVVEKKYGADNDDKDFGGFKKTVDAYKNGMISKKDIFDEYNSINNDTNPNNIHFKNNKFIASGYKEILSLIADDGIKLDEQKILDSIVETNTNLLDKDYFTKDKYDNIIPSTYTGLLEDPLKLQITDINKKINNIYTAAETVSKGGTDDKKDVKILKQTIELYNTLNKIHNLVENKIYDINTQKDLDKYAYNRDGYDRDWYDRDGYDREGFNKEGINKQGLNRKDVEEIL